MWRHKPSNFKAGPFKTKGDAVEHAHADLYENGILDW
jgi:hypothetical protein